jgi:hypothetical protein
MNKPDVLVQVGYLLLSGTVLPGINVYQMTAVPKFPGKLPDINTHTPGVFCSQIAHGA